MNSRARGDYSGSVTPKRGGTWLLLSVGVLGVLACEQLGIRDMGIRGSRRNEATGAASAEPAGKAPPPAPAPTPEPGAPAKCDILGVDAVYWVDYTKVSGDCEPNPDKLERFRLSTPGGRECQVADQTVSEDRCKLDRVMRCTDGTQIVMQFVEDVGQGFHGTWTWTGECELTESFVARPQAPDQAQ